jgi:predicted transcriptional regulator
MPENDNSDVSVDAETAHKEYNQNGLKQSQIAEKYNVSQPYVSKLISGYETGKSKGKEEVSPGDFSEDSLRDALEDSADTDRYEHTCPKCKERIPSPNSPGEAPCPECGATLQWSQEEI